MKGRSLARTDALAQSLGRLGCPVWAIYGEEDALYRGKLDGAAGGPGAGRGFQGLALVEGAGHWLQFERAEASTKPLLTALDAA